MVIDGLDAVELVEAIRECFAILPSEQDWLDILLHDPSGRDYAATPLHPVALQHPATDEKAPSTSNNPQETGGSESKSNAKTRRRPWAFLRRDR